MQITASALTNQTVLQPVADDEGQYDIPRGLYLAITGGLEAQSMALDHLRESGQVQPGDVIDINWPVP